MFSQSITAQLIRMLLLLGICLFLIQVFPSVRDLIAMHAIDSGCHQVHQMEHSHIEHSAHHH